MLGDGDFRSLSEEELVEKAKEIPHAFGYLYEIYIDKIYNFIFYRTFDRDVSEDLTHTVFEKVLTNIKSYQKGTSSFAAWIFRIARNQLIDYYRKKKSLPLSEEMESKLFSEDDLLAQLVKGEKQEKVFMAVSNLSKDQREVINLRYKGDLSNKEIAQIIGRSEGAVKAILHRAVENLRRRLNHEES